MPVPYVSPRFQAIDGSGNPLVGGKLYTYANTTTTPQTTYQDAAGTIANTNPIILDSRGEAVIFLTEQLQYTFVLKDQNDALIWSQDSISGSDAAQGGITVVTSLPSSDVGPVYMAGSGIYTWNGTEYTSDYSRGFGGSSYALRNKLINGCFRIWDKGIAIGPITSASGTTTTGNRWRVAVGGSASVTVTRQSGGGPGGYAQNSVGPYSARIGSNAAATPGASDRNVFLQAIEGQSLLNLALGSIAGGFFTISFWVRAQTPGTYCVAFLNSGTPVNRSYISEYTISSVLGWEFKKITVPIDQSGIANWDRTTGIGLNVVFDLGSGSALEGVANTWLSTASTRTTGSTRLVSSTTASLEFSNIQLEFGSTNTPFEDRPIGLETSLCQRYFQRYLNYPSEVGYAGIATTGYNLRKTFPPMRATPSVVAGSATLTNCTASVVAVNNQVFTFSVVNTAVGNWAAALAALDLDAELG